MYDNQPLDHQNKDIESTNQTLRINNREYDIQEDGPGVCIFTINKDRCDQAQYMKDVLTVYLTVFACMSADSRNSLNQHINNPITPEMVMKGVFEETDFFDMHEYLLPFTTRLQDEISEISQDETNTAKATCSIWGCELSVYPNWKTNMYALMLNTEPQTISGDRYLLTPAAQYVEDSLKRFPYLNIDVEQLLNGNLPSIPPELMMQVYSEPR
jgi:hypothetical protein